MKISDFLSPADVVIDMRIAQKELLLRDLARRAALNLGLEADYVSSELLKREEFGSTGMGRGVAVPHARLPMVREPYGIMTRLKQPIDFAAIDGEPVDLFFSVLLPATAGRDQLGALALVARKLRTPECLVQLRRARTESELYEAITR